MSDGQKYGVVYADKCNLSFGDFEPGDIFMVQRNTKTKVANSPNAKVLGANQEILVSKVVSKSLVDKNEYRLASTLKNISSEIFKTNLYFPNEILSHIDLNYLVKVTFDKNNLSPKQMAEMRRKMFEIKSELEKNYPKLAEKTVFTLNPTNTGHEGWRLQVNDVKRADVMTM